MVSLHSSRTVTKTRSQVSFAELALSCPDTGSADDPSACGHTYAAPTPPGLGGRSLFTRCAILTACLPFLKVESWGLVKASPKLMTFLP